MTAAAHRDDLRQDRAGDLLGTLAPEVQAGRAVDACAILVGELDALRGQLHQEALGTSGGPEHPDVGDGRCQERAEVRLVPKEVVRHDHDERPLVRGRDLRRVVGLLHVDEPGRLGVALPVQEPRPVVDDDGTPAEDRGGLHQRDGVVTGPADQQPERGLQHLDERSHVAGQRPDLGRLRGELLLGRTYGLRVDVRIPERALRRAVGLHDDPRTGRDVVARRLEHRHDADGTLFLQGHPEGARDLRRAVGRFDEDLDGAVAAQPEPPDLVVVGGEVPAGQTRPALLHDELGHVGDVAFQATAGDVPDRRAILGDQQARPRPAVRRAADRDDRRERHPLALGRQGLDRLEHVADLAHRSMVRESPRRGEVPPGPRLPGGSRVRSDRTTLRRYRTTRPVPVRKEGSP